MPQQPQQVMAVNRVFCAGVLCVAMLAAGCEGPPARSKPWRHRSRSVALGPESNTSRRTALILEQETGRVAARRERENTLRVHMDGAVGHLHPLITPTLWGRRITAGTVFESLIRFAPGEAGASGRYEPGLAQRWVIAPGGREIRIELQPDVEFHSGARMTSVDVQFTLDAARSPRYRAHHVRRMLSDVTAVELINSRALRIRLARPNADVLRALAEIPILPQAVYENRLRGGLSGPAVGTGPYRVSELSARSVRLQRNPSYWGPAPKIENVVFVAEADGTRALIAAKDGELDVLSALAPVHYPEQLTAPGVAGRLSPIELHPPAFQYLALNATRPPFDDVRVRQAVSLLIDRDQLVEQAFKGLARKIAEPIWPGGPAHGPRVEPPERDPHAAAQLLDAAGYRDVNGDGVREHGGRRLMITVLATESDDAMRELVLESLKAAGFVLDVRVGPAAVLQNRMRERQFDLAFVSWTGAVDSDIGSLVETRGAHNGGGFSSPEIDRLVNEARSAWYPEQRAPIIAKLGEAMARLQPVIPLVAPEPHGLVSTRIRGLTVWDGWFSIPDLYFAPAQSPE